MSCAINYIRQCYQLCVNAVKYMSMLLIKCQCYQLYMSMLSLYMHSSWFDAAATVPVPWAVADERGHQLIPPEGSSQSCQVWRDVAFDRYLLPASDSSCMSVHLEWCLAVGSMCVICSLTNPAFLHLNAVCRFVCVRFSRVA